MNRSLASSPIQPRPRAHASACNWSRTRAPSRSSNWRCPTAAATASMRTWGGSTSCTTSSPRPSSRWSPGAGAFRSAAASVTAATSTRTTRAVMACGWPCRATTSASSGVPTYSTLGYLPDPVFGAMLAWRDTRLVGTIFHELAHERLYFAGDSALNEAFANVVEDEGVRRWLRQQGARREIAAYEASIARQKEFAALLLEARARLARLYATPLAPEQMRIEKQREFGRLLYQLRGDAAGSLGRVRGIRCVVRAVPQQCASGGGGDLRGLRPRPARAAAGVRIAAEFYRCVEATREMNVAERRAALCRRNGRRYPIENMGTLPDFAKTGLVRTAAKSGSVPILNRVASLFLTGTAAGRCASRCASAPVPPARRSRRSSRASPTGNCRSKTACPARSP